MIYFKLDLFSFYFGLEIKGIFLFIKLKNNFISSMGLLLVQKNFILYTNKLNKIYFAK